MPPVSGKQRKAKLKLKRAIKRGDQQPEQPNHLRETPRARTAAGNQSKDLQSQFVKLDKQFLDDTRALADSIVLTRPIQSDAAVLDIPQPGLAPLTVPKRPRWRYQMSKEELDANEQAHFRTWLAQQDAITEQWQHTLNSPPVDQTNPEAAQQVRACLDDSGTRQMPHPPTHFERNIEVWRQFWRVTEISQILLVLLDSRCPSLHLPSSLSTYLNVLTSASPPESTGSHAKRSPRSKGPRVILVLTKVDISGPARTESWTSFLNHNYPGVPVVPVEAYAQKPFIVKQGPTRYEPHLPGTFRERLVHTLQDVHAQLLQPPQWVTATRAGECEQERLRRVDRWKPRVKRIVNWDGVLNAKGKLVGKAVGGSAVPGPDLDNGVSAMDSEEERPDGAYEWKEPEFLTIGLIGQPNVGKSSLLNAIFGTTRVRASRTPGKTKHFQTLFWTPDVRLVDCPGLVMPSFVPMDIQVLSGILPISRIAAVPFCVHQLAQLLQLEWILELTHPSESTTSGSSAIAAVASTKLAQSRKSASKSELTNPTPEDKRTWRSGQRPLKRTNVSSGTPGWTANDIMTAYAEKKRWVTAKAGRPDVHRAGNAILRLVAEGKIPWGFWPPGSSVSNGDGGIWLKDGVQQHTEGDLESDSEEEELASDEDNSEVEVKVATGESDDENDQEGYKPVSRGNLFAALSIDSE